MSYILDFFCLEKSPSNLRSDIKSEHLRYWAD